MSKPDDIPQSVWDAACVKALEYVEWLIPQPSDIEGSEYVLAGVIARAIMAETEACAALLDCECEDPVCDLKESAARIRTRLKP